MMNPSQLTAAPGALASERPYLFAPLQPETRRILDNIPGLIDKTFPLPGRFRSALPTDVAELSRLLTSGRGERSLSYLGRPNMLSAYLRYFLVWNLYRLCRLLPALDFPLAAGDAVTDIGSGPLTFTAALWISRPDLRDRVLEFRCIDRSGPALEAGKKFFAAIAGNESPWRIRTIRGDIGTRSGSEKHGGPLSVRGKPAALVSAVNIFNEMYGDGDTPHSDRGGLQRNAGRAVRLLEEFAPNTASILTVEPGVPRSGQFISMLRDVLIGKKRPPAAPCPHCGTCPFPGGESGNTPKGGKNRWCHFAFETEDAPADLHRLSAQAGIPKERAVLSFLLTGPVGTTGAAEQPSPPPHIPVRIISDPFSLPERRFGRYGCSVRGLILIRGDRNCIENKPSGMLIDAAIAQPEQRDPKSGALLSTFL